MPEPVMDGVWRVDLGQVNAYLVETDEGPVLVDAGLPGSVEMIREAIRETGQDPDELVGVLVTHTDMDHVGSLAELVEASDARVFASEMASALLVGEGKIPWMSTKGLFQRVTGFLVSPPPADRLRPVSEGDTALGFRVVETPGHGLGHVAFAREDGLVFVGDLVRFDEAEPRLSPSFANYDTEEASRSLAHLLETLDTIEVACPGHGAPISDGARKALESVLGRTEDSTRI